MKTGKPRVDVYQQTTDRIIEQLETGVAPWSKPWHAEHAAGRIEIPLRHNGQPYKGINVLMLWMGAEINGYVAPIWMTFRQAKELGGCVRKGEHGSKVVYANAVTRTEHNDKTGEDEERTIPFLKQYTVFNVEQIDGLPERYTQLAETPHLTPLERQEELERFFAATGAQVIEGGGSACYSVSHDVIRMPPLQTFRDAESYYATLAHETTHWTRHPSRLDRNMGRKKWGDEGYAMEELVAELGAAFLGASLGVAVEPREDHAAYIENWLQVLKGDKRAIFTAASHAQRAADYLHSLQPQSESEPLAEAA